MKKTLIFIVLLTLGFGSVFSQTDNYGNPVFNSISTNEKSIDDFLLIANYYTLKNNIENNSSSVFISERPTLNEIEHAAINLASDFFILTKESKIVVMIMLQSDPDWEFMSIEMRKNKQSTFSANLIGDITENRAKEIIKEKYDTTATIENGYLKFNGKKFKIISNKEVEKAVLELIKKEKLDKRKPSDMILPSQKEIKSFILSETKQDGKLDFFTGIKGSEYDGVQIKQGVFTTKKSVALYKWGRACFDIGINTVEDAYKIFAEHQGEPVNSQDKESIKAGFYKEWERN